MMNWLVLYKKEVNTYRYSPIAYVTTAIYLLISGYFFFAIISRYSNYSMQAMSRNSRAGGNLNPTEMILRPLYLNMCVVALFVVPLLTMRLLAEEKRTGTAEVLFTHPIRDWEVVWAKFLACLSVFGAVLLVSFQFPLMVAMVGQIEWGPVLAIYLGLLLLGGAFIAFGLLASSLTEHQIVAAVITLGGLLLFWLMGWAAESTTGGLAKVLEQLSFYSHLDNFMKGVVDTHDVLFFLSFSVFCFYLTLQVLGSKQWRS